MTEDLKKVVTDTALGISERKSMLIYGEHTWSISLMLDCDTFICLFLFICAIYDAKRGGVHSFYLKRKLVLIVVFLKSPYGS